MGRVAIREGIGSQSSLPSAPTSLGWGCRQQGPLRVNDSHSGRLCVLPSEQTALGYRAPLVVSGVCTRAAHVGAQRSSAVSLLTEAAHCN